MHTRVPLPTGEPGPCGWRILTQERRHTSVPSLKTVGKMGLSLRYNFFFQLWQSFAKSFKNQS